MHSMFYSLSFLLFSLDEKFVPVPYEPLDNCAAAGAINSSVHDMSKWLKCQLSKGSYSQDGAFK